MLVDDWEKVYSEKGIVQNEVLFTVKKAADLMRRNGCSKILDLACGTGRHAIYLASCGFSVFGIDISKSAIEISKSRAKRLGLQNVQLKVGEMLNIDFPDDFFDGVICVWSTCHGLKNDVRKYVDEMKRVVKKGGLICADFMSVADKDFMRGICIEENTFLHDHLDHPNVPHHYSTEEELEDFFSDCIKKTITPITYDDPDFSSVIKSFWVEAYK